MGGTPVALLAAVLVGATLGLLGAGGSIMTVPILIYLVGLAPRIAMSTSLVVVGVTSAVAAGVHGRAGHVRLRTAIPFAAAGIPGAYLGGRLAQELSNLVLLTLFAGFMLLAAWALLRPSGGEETYARTGGPRSTGAILTTASYGAVIGVITGLLGAGGGFLIVPALVFLQGLPLRDAIGTSLVIITTNCAAGVVARADLHAIPPGLAVLFSAISVAGALAGHVLGRRLPVRTLRRIFAAVVLVVAVVMITEAWLQ